MIITISGQAGSGKSTVAKLLAKKLEYKHYSIGDLRRRLAREKGMTLEEYNKLGEKDPSTDREPDEYVQKLGKEEDNFVIEGRIAFHFITRSVKVYITVNERAGAERIWKDLQDRPGERNEARISSLQDVERSVKERVRSDKARYKKYYQIDHTDLKQYDLVIDSTNIPAEEVVEKILEFLKK